MNENTDPEWLFLKPSDYIALVRMERDLYRRLLLLFNLGCRGKDLR